MEVIKDDYIRKIEVVKILQEAYTEGRIKAKDGCVSVLDDINALPKAKDLEYGTEQLEMEIKSGLWIEGSEPELHCKEGIALNKQLIEWLTELKWRREMCAQYEVEQISDLERYDMLFRECELLNERYEEAKRLLKSAVDEWPFLCEWGECGEYCCWFQNGRCTQEWSNKAEALALIGEDGDAE